MSWGNTLSYATFTVLNNMGFKNIFGYEVHQLYADEGVEVVDGVFIGSLATALNKRWLYDNNIGAIVNLSNMRYPTDLPSYEIDMIDKDVTEFELQKYINAFMRGAHYIAAARAKGLNVLVHCAAGVNRSACTIGFYINGSYEMVMAALLKANHKRGTTVLTNPSFRYILRAKCAFTYDNQQLA